MKMIIAMIQPHRLQDVQEELFSRNIKKMTVSHVLGCGQQAGYTENYRGTVKNVRLLKKTRLEIAVNDDHVKTTIEGISKAAFSGQIGDGKIFVQSIEQCIRIRTQESGNDAIG